MFYKNVTASSIETQKSDFVSGRDNKTQPDIFRRKVLAWLETMRDTGSPVWEYRLFDHSDATVYGSCFAIYLRNLFDDLRDLAEDQKREWTNYIQSFQDEESGLFKDPKSGNRTLNSNHNEVHLSHQLTTFCLSALECFDESSKYPLYFVKDWYEKDKLIGWLESLNWKNPWNSGNKVMFLAICLIYNYEKFEDQEALDALDVWFEWMDAHQKPQNGFWGKTRISDYFYGMGGFYHQYVIYNHMNRPVNYEDKVVDSILKLQQHDGLFYPGNGGGSCDDIDGVHPLVGSYHYSDYRHEDIRFALKRALTGLLKSQNPDGGFCWANRRYYSAVTYWNLLIKNLGRADLYYWYYCNRKFFGKVRKSKDNRFLETGWSTPHRLENQSSIFDAWLTCTTIGEICSVLKDEPLGNVPWRFLKTPGLGWFDFKSQGSNEPRVMEIENQVTEL